MVLSYMQPYKHNKNHSLMMNTYTTGFDPHTGEVDLQHFFNGSSAEEALWSHDLVRVVSSTWVTINYTALLDYVEEFKSTSGLGPYTTSERASIAQVHLPLPLFLVLLLPL